MPEDIKWQSCVNRGTGVDPNVWPIPLSCKQPPNYFLRTCRARRFRAAQKRSVNFYPCSPGQPCIHRKIFYSQISSADKYTLPLFSQRTIISDENCLKARSSPFPNLLDVHQNLKTGLSSPESQIVPGLFAFFNLDVPACDQSFTSFDWKWMLSNNNVVSRRRRNPKIVGQTLNRVQAFSDCTGALLLEKEWANAFGARRRGREWDLSISTVHGCW